MSNSYFKVIEKFLANGNLARDNANYVRSIMVMDHKVAGAVMKDYFFDEICQGLPIRKFHEDGWVYMHQLNKLSPYCLGLSSRDVALFGLRSNAKNERASAPPKRLETLFQQCANLICLVAQETSGATSLNDLSTVGAGYLWYMEKVQGREVSDYDLKNIWQEFLYNVNLPFRSGNSPFTNITLEFGKPDAKLKYARVAVAGKELDVEYKDIPSVYFDRVNLGFIEAMRQGDADGKPFTFPLVTVNVVEDFDWDNEVFLKFVEYSKFWGGFYVQNYLREPFEKATEYAVLNPYLKPLDPGAVYSNCCRMNFNIDLVQTVTGSNPFHSHSGVGGIGVYAINLNRLMWLAGRDFDLLIRGLEYFLQLGREVLKRKRAWIRRWWEDLYPYMSFYQRTDRSLYNIFSIVGGHEGLMSAGFEEGIFNKEAQKLVHKIAQYMVSRLEQFMREDQQLYCLEYAPSESAAVTMAKADMRLPDVVQLLATYEQETDETFIAWLKDCAGKQVSKIQVSGNKEVGDVFLTSGFMPPFAEQDLLKQIDISCQFQSYATGGSVQHFFIGEDLTGQELRQFVKNVVTSFPVQYFTVTPLLTVCEECGAKFQGKHTSCKNCGGVDVTVWCRPVGYFRPVMRKRIASDFKSAEYKFWLDARIEDFSTRKTVGKEDLFLSKR